MEDSDQATQGADASQGSRCRIERDSPGGESARLVLSGNWRSAGAIPSAEETLEQLGGAGNLASLTFDTSQLGDWGSGLLTFLRRLTTQLPGDVDVDDAGLADGVRRLLALAAAVPESSGARKGPGHVPLVARIGGSAIHTGQTAVDAVGFIGESFLAFGRLLRGKAQFRWGDVLLIMQDCGAGALGIVSLISFLIGLILAYVGAAQLQTFGASIYVADLVAVAVTREMGAIMTAIVMAGRTGASFAAQLGTMQVNEEIDAFKTMGVSPMEHLVLPRMLALVLMMPLLVLYADIMGMLGGLVIGVTMLDLPVLEYYHQTVEAVTLTGLAIGLVKGAIFGVIVAVCGCMKGMQCGRSASAVGEATTSAVVMGIVFIITSDAIIAVICDIIGI